MKIRPLHDQVLVKRAEGKDVTEGGIIIPDTAKEKSVFAEVVAVGSGRVAEDGGVRPLDVHAGDTVVLAKYAGTEVVVDDVEHLMIREDNVLAVVVEENEAPEFCLGCKQLWQMVADDRSSLNCGAQKDGDPSVRLSAKMKECPYPDDREIVSDGD